MKPIQSLVAAAAALLVSGAAHADFVRSSDGNGSLHLAVFNVVTNAVYYRDLGYLLNNFLPSNVTTAGGDGGTGNPNDTYAGVINATGTPITGTRTPDGGLLLDKSNSANFAGSIDGNWASFIGANSTVTDLRWTITAGDAQSISGTNNVSRFLVTANTPGTINNQAVTNSASSLNALSNQFDPGVISVAPDPSVTTVASVYASNVATGDAALGLIGQASNVYYYVRTQGTLANSTVANRVQFANAGGAATFTLASNGDVVYSAPAAVPLPAAAWLFGTGLIGLIGYGRKRRSAA